MSAGEYCNRDVVVVAKSDTVQEAINLMRQYHVGTVVVVEETGDKPKPVGILTDRDILIEILAEDVELDAVTIGDVMSYEIVTVMDDSPLLDAVSIMKDKGVRRLPVVNHTGGLEGILSVDDVIDLLAEELSNIAKLISKEQHQEQVKRN
jgi:CBS domain-containing protein